MALTKCAECGGQVSTAATSCPHCGAVQKKPVGAVGRVLAGGCLAGILLIAVGVGISTMSPSPSSRSPSFGVPSALAPPPAAPAAPMLRINRFTWYVEYSYAIAEGTVTNLTDASLRSVEAVVSYYDGNGQFVTSDDALIEFNPILSGQTSPFKTMTTYNPAIRTASIEFKELMGGTIPSVQTPSTRRR
jgi:hypothetical protein